MAPGKALIEDLKAATASTAIIACTAFAWRAAFPYGDVSLVVLLPMFLTVFLGARDLDLQQWHAIRGLVLKEAFLGSRWFTGKLRAFLLSFALAAATIALAAWQFVSVTREQLIGLILVGGISGFLALQAETTLRRQLNQPFNRRMSASLTTWGLSLTFVPLYALIVWQEAQDGRLLQASFPDVVDIGLQRFDQIPGAVGSFLSGMNVIDSAKLWLTVETRIQPLSSIIFSLDSALFCILYVRGSIMMVHVFKPTFQDRPNDR